MTISRSCSNGWRGLLATLVLSTGLVGGASADVFDVGAVTDEPYINSMLHPSGSFLDVYNFSVSKVTNLVLGAVTNEISNPSFGSILSIGGLKLGLFNSSNPGVLAFPLMAGNYSVEVSGTAKGRSGGAYLFSMAAPIAPVPEPAIWVSLLVGGVLVTRLVRRERS
jgi:hypothetical protein